MAQKTNLVVAAGKIKAAIEEFVAPAEKVNIRIFASSPGLLRAFVGSDKFKGLSPMARQRAIWKYLDGRLNWDYRRFCAAVHALDVKEFQERTLPSWDNGGGNGV
ncbi:MAG: hypothetical protein HOP29_05430 [Phycisphaerales bacterium]|nr:hypothetical protein [Phycisphaerales bacterium]